MNRLSMISGRILFLSVFTCGLPWLRGEGVPELVPGVPLPLKGAEGVEKVVGGGAAALETADYLLGQLVTDEDEHWKAQTRLCRVLIRQGRDAEAKARMKTFGPSYQSLLAATLALEWQRRGVSGEVVEAAKLAETSLAASDTWKTMRTNALLAELALAQRDEVKARAWLARVTDPLDRRSCEAEYILAKPEPEQVDAFLGRPAKEFHAYQSRLLVGLAERAGRAGRKEEAEERLRRAAAVCIGARHPAAAQSLPPVIEAMHGAGMEKDAVETIGTYVAMCRKYPEDAEWKAPSLAEGGRLYRLVGKPELGVGLEGEAEKSSRAVFFLYAPAGWVACARLALQRGDAAEAKRFVGEAVKNAAAYPHPRGRAMGLFETALYFLEERQEAAAEVLGELKK